MKNPELSVRCGRSKQEVKLWLPREELPSRVLLVRGLSALRHRGQQECRKWLSSEPAEWGRVKNNITQNVEQILAHGKNLGSFCNKTEDVEVTFEHFKKHRRRRLQSCSRRMWRWQPSSCECLYHHPLHHVLCHWQHAHLGRRPSYSSGVNPPKNEKRDSSNFLHMNSAQSV